MGVELWKREVVYCSATLAIVANTLLLLFICRFSKPHMGNYKVLMASFASFDIYFSIIQVITVPNFHIYRHCFIAFSLSPWLKGNPWDVENIGLTLYCCAYAMCLVLLTYHFIYRYLLICNHHLMYLFDEKKYLASWYLVWLILAITWGLFVRFTMYHTPELRNYVRNDLLTEYSIDVDQAGILGPLYFLDGPNGSLIVSWRAFAGSGFCITLMSCCFGTILFCAMKVYLTLKQSSMSEKTRKLQWDLFKALLVQFSVPTICEFMPGGANFLCPIFGIPLGRWANFSGIIASLNNFIEPLCMLYFVKDYRYVLLRALRLPHFRSQVYNSSDANHSQAGSHVDVPVGGADTHPTSSSSRSERDGGGLFLFIRFTLPIRQLVHSGVQIARVAAVSAPKSNPSSHEGA